MNTCFALPGIRSIAWCYVSRLAADLELLAISGIPVVASAPYTDIPFSGEPTCECAASNENNGSNEKATLSFRSRVQIPYDDYLAFLVTDTNGQCWLLGTADAPHPLISRTQSFGTPGGDPNTFSYEITHASVKALIPCTH